MPLTRHVDGRDAMRERLSVLLMAAFLLFAATFYGTDGNDDTRGTEQARRV